MRYKRNKMLMPKTSFKAPAEFFKNDPDIDLDMMAVVVLYLMGGWSKKSAWTAIYHPRCKPNSIAPQASAFFGLKEVKGIIELFRNYYVENFYLNPKAWERR
jgi:hypothetical protein